MKTGHNYEFIRALLYVNAPFTAHLIICYFLIFSLLHPFSFFSDSQYQKGKIKRGQKKDEGVEI